MKTLLAVLAAVLLGCSPKLPPTTEWPMSPIEKQSSRGTAGRVALVREDIARIASGDEVLAQRILAIALAVQSLDRDDAELRFEAAKSRGISVAVVQSGWSWVEAK